MNIENIPTEFLIDCLPQNMPLYKDSGLWSVRDEGLETIYCAQDITETFRDFILRYFKRFESDETVMTDLSFYLLKTGDTVTGQSIS